MSNSIQNDIERMSPWFHNLHLPDGTETAPDHFLGDFPAFKWQQIRKFIPQNLSGRTALDIGCNAGFYSFELARRGARVTAIDLDSHYLKQAKWAAGQFGLKDAIQFKQQQVYDLAYENKKYDLIWFTGLLYHLRYPLLALDIVTQKAREILVLQTLTLPGNERTKVPEDLYLYECEKMCHPGWPKMAFVESKLEGDPTNWWTPNQACVEAMLRSCGMKITAQPSDEVCIAVPDPENPSPATTWNRSEYLSATGRKWNKEIIHKTSKTKR